MTDQGTTTTNIADGNATVGVQASTVHEVNVYHSADSDPPEAKYESGVRYLDGGMPAKARQLIDEAIIAGYATSEVWFHWLLALISDRTIRQFSGEDLSRLRSAQRQLPLDEDSEWAQGVRIVIGLLDSLKNPDIDPRTLFKELDELDTPQRDKILRHLDLLLKGPFEDDLWKRAIERVRTEQTAGDRGDRVWMFFEPLPAPPRVRQPSPVALTLTRELATTAVTTAFIISSGYLGWTLLRAGNVKALVAYLACIAGLYICATQGVEWRFRAERMRALDNQYRVPIQRGVDAPPGGFAHQVDRLYRHYFAWYVPHGVDRSVWLADTAGICRTLRDETVEVYRESRTSASAVAWLIRYQVTDVRKRWLAGTLLAHRDHLRTRIARKLATVLGLVALVIGGMWAMVSAVWESPMTAPAAAVLAIASGIAAARSNLRIALERRKFAADRKDSAKRLADSFAAYQRWQTKLSHKPADSEMAAWLDCDRKMLMDWAMRHYRLTANAVISHAFLEAPAANGAKRARVRNGPWRYTRYRLLLFLLTMDGVRQVSADLDFETAGFADGHRTNYRFDAVAAVRVTEADGYPQKLELTLVDGKSIDAKVTESGAEQLQVGEDFATLSAAASDASGLTTALHILEGIAAEGKEWVRHEIRRGEGRITALTSAVHGLVD